MITEIIIIGIMLLALFFFILILSSRINLWRLRKNYDPNDDLSKKGEEARAFRRRDTGFASPEQSSVRPKESLRRTLFPTATPLPSGEDNSGVGRTKQASRRRRIKRRFGRR